ncbi:MAG: sigma-70 family RNA polymerase sigma factor [Flavobacteriales bacterium]|nr:MAG: sigma-70 family RNA polymerase sigma factor [Flavobacteriales bacterium]
MTTSNSPQSKVIVPPGAVAPGTSCAIAASSAASLQLAPVPLPTTALSACATGASMRKSGSSTNARRANIASFSSGACEDIRHLSCNLTSPRRRPDSAGRIRSARLRSIRTSARPMNDSADEVTQLLRRWHAGESAALDALLPRVYAELRQLAAHELRGHRNHETLQPTALVNEVFARLLGAGKVDLVSRKHLFTTAAKLMRQTLIDRARAQQREKRGAGQWQRADFLEVLALPIEADTLLPALDEALTSLANLDPRVAQIVELRYFVGLEVSEVAALLEIDERTVYRDWAFARAWLRQRMEA